MNSCKKGYYYCNTEQKCKPIPDGYTVKDDGFLVKEDKQILKIVKQLRKSVKSHAKQADTLEKKISESKKDHEPEMIRNQLKTAGRASKRIEKHSRKKDNFKAWVQSKITKASDYLDTAADYLDSKEVNEEGLRAWFGKSSGTTKSGRKVKGWVQVGGKYDGKPCARQPGQKTTPKCTSSSKRSSMSDKERDSAARRKRAADPGQPQKSGAAAPTMVSTDPKKKMKEEFTTLPLRLELPQSSLDFKQGLMFRESLDTDGGMLFVFDNIAQQSFHMTETKIPLDIAFIREDGVIESIKELEPNNPAPVYSEGAIELAIEVNRGWFAENNVEAGDVLDIEYIIPNQREKYRSETNTIYDIISEVKDKKGKGSGSKDACYHKVKSRYSVWPSAYASGALVKCRKVGAANWGNKSEEYKVTNEGMATPEKGTGKYYNEKKPTAKQLEARKKMFPAKTDAQKAATKKYDKIKELGNKGQHKAASDLYKEGVVEIQNSDGQTFAGVIDIVGPANMKTVTNENGVWQGTEQISEMKRDEYGDPIGGPKISKKQLKKNLAANTPDEKHTTTTSEAMNPAQQAAIAISKKQRIMDLMVAKKKKKGMKEENLDEKCWKGYEKKGMKTMFGKRYPNCVKKKVGESMVNWREDLNIEEGAAWTKKSGKSASGGLNEKGRKSYERDNPGSDLKAPSKKVGNPRRKSFCARMKGMKKKLTSAKTARDPDSRINKSLRAWNC